MEGERSDKGGKGQLEESDRAVQGYRRGKGRKGKGRIGKGERKTAPPPKVFLPGLIPAGANVVHRHTQNFTMEWVKIQQTFNRILGEHYC